MKKFIVIIFSVLCLKSYAGSNFDVGTGSGSITLNSMTGHSRGDTANIVAGSYTGATFSNLFGIYIRNKNGGAVTFTGTVNMFTDSGVVFTGSLSNYILFSGITGNGINNNTGTVGNGLVDCRIDYVSFKNCTSACIDGEGNMPYTQGNPSSYHFLRDTIQHIIEHFCPKLLQGSFGTPGDGAGHPPDVYRQLVIDTFAGDSTSSGPPSGGEGNEISGICFHCTFHDLISTSISVNNPSGDVGLVFIYGWLKAWNLYKNGGPGYLIRNFTMQEDIDPGRDTAWNLLKANSSGYAGITIEFDTTQSVSGQWHGTGGNFYNITSVNNTECCGFWGPVVNNGTVPPYEHYFVGNLLGANLQTNGKNPIAYNLGGWNSIGQDTLPNTSRYYTSVTAALLDSLTSFIINSSANFKKYSPLLSSGARNAGKNVGSPYGTDIYGFDRPGGPNWDAGAAQFEGSGGSCTANAGPNQSITLPTDTITLNGSASASTTGTITSYVWSQVSGPTIASIATPNNVTTIVTNFIPGTYVFQLNIVDINNNVSNDQMVLIVNPVPGLNTLKSLNRIKLVNK